MKITSPDKVIEIDKKMTISDYRVIKIKILIANIVSYQNFPYFTKKRFLKILFDI